MAKKLELKKAKKSNAYNADSLRTLPFPDNVRHRPGMYLSSRDEPGVRRAWKEIIDNSIDEHQNGHGNKIVCHYNTKTGTFLLADQGRGVPSGYNKKEKKTGFEIVFGTLHGGGKFDTGNYSTSGGLHGVGAAATQACSSKFQVWSYNEGVWKTQTFKEGRSEADVKKASPPEEFAKAKRGTVIQWTPDTKVFSTKVIDTEKMLETCKSLAMLNPGLEILVVIDNKKHVFKSENGLLDMIYGTQEQKQVTLAKPFHFQAKGVIDIAVTWHDTDTQSTFSYVNSSHTPEEGTHVQGARNAILEALRAEADTAKKTPAKKPTRGRGKAEKDTGIDSKFLLMGMQLAMNWRMSDPVYSGQTKDKLTNSEVVTKVKNMVLPEFSAFLKKNPKLIAILLDRAKKFQKAADKFNNDMKAVKSITLGNPSARGLLPGKLAQATGKYRPDEIELFLVEGDSAAGPAKEIRLPWQEVLALRGKILNAARAELASVLSSEEVMNIITSTGAKPGEDCRTSGGSVRIGRINIMTDADSDGKHIRSLLIAFFIKYFRPWIDEGRISFVELPLFVGAHGDHKEFGFTREEMINKFPEAKRKNLLVNRLKGLGEMTNTELFVYGMDPSTRRVRVITMSDADAVEVQRIMGDDATYRKEFLGIAKREK